MTTEPLPRLLSRAALLAALLVPGLALAAPQAPDLQVQTLSGKSVSLSDYRGKLVMLNFWAPWCPPCRQEMPDLEAFHEKYDDTVVLGLAVDYRSKGNVTNMVDMMNVTYPVALADQAVASKFGGFRGLPTTFYIAPDGRILGKHAGLLPAKLMEKYRRRFLDKDGQAGGSGS
ncbi:MAG TPA: TlpA disulfide reductase family protein [Gammaproteobacteria bacterium]|nr:TlpA disulfide reductase family protein [Gammaproteobacteria bacterium]